MTGLAESFVVFPGTCPTQTIKEGFYKMAGIDMVSQGAWLYRLYPYTDLCVSCTFTYRTHIEVWVIQGNYTFKYSHSTCFTLGLSFSITWTHFK
ncbi:hypothetical protein F7725_010603 [Dissostichus mawsoni]|uniref:Uncharacterized protein n=1 Tax=Dissostichus mawsoni TaxID=36200 RepID=A0A7J5XNY2_DISMA|nr:hypothetical protein F7725_010603 [Dissostichus mawsoni]